MNRRRTTPGGMAVSAIAYGVAAFLMLPTVLIVPMSFGPDQFLRFPPNGFTLHWYAEYFTDPDWLASTLFSLEVAVLTALLATVIGTLVSLALVGGRLPGRSLIELLVMGPVIVPNIALAIAMFLVFDRLRLVGTLFGFVAAHTALAMPFVVFTVLAALYRFDADLELAALSCGAGRIAAFRHVTLPLIAPGVVSAALFAFIISFDEPVISFFISDLDRKTLPRKMFEDINFNISPTLAAVAAMLSALTLLALAASHFLRNRSAPNSSHTKIDQGDQP
jgi:mannopine transport system permease protein